RRASMYDPLVVDTFVKVHAELAPEQVASGSSQTAFTEITHGAHTPQPLGASHLDEIAASADEMLTLYELATSLADHTNVADTGDAIAKHVRRLIPASLCVFYSYDTERDEIHATHVVGDSGSNVKGLRIPLGQRLSGWVAANRQSIVNSDPTLDLGEVARAATPRLKSCLSTPVVCEDQLVGVLSLYSSTQDCFTEEHRRILEVVALQTAHSLKRALERNLTTRHREAPIQLPGLGQLEEAVNRRFSRNLHILLIGVANLKGICARHGNSTGEAAVRKLVNDVRECLGDDDILFSHGIEELIVLLNSTNATDVEPMMNRIRDRVLKLPLITIDGDRLRVEPSVSVLANTSIKSASDLVSSLRHRKPSDST